MTYQENISFNNIDWYTISWNNIDFNAFSSANLLAKLLEMRNTYMEENETLLSRYAWLCNDNIKNIFKRNNK